MTRRLALAAAVTAGALTGLTAPAAATTPCPTPAAHVWCGLGYSGDITFHWWNGLDRIVNHGHVPESA